MRGVLRCGSQVSLSYTPAPPTIPLEEVQVLGASSVRDLTSVKWSGELSRMQTPNIPSPETNKAKTQIYKLLRDKFLCEAAKAFCESQAVTGLQWRGRAHLYAIPNPALKHTYAWKNQESPSLDLMLYSSALPTSRLLQPPVVSRVCKHCKLSLVALLFAPVKWVS